MSNHLYLGMKGEFKAMEYLLALGYKILERNWRFGRAEIDIIAMDDQTLVFIEVKTRSYIFYGNPESFVSKKKQKFIMDAASEYMIKTDYEWAIRFDIIGIVINDEGTHLSHFKDAFFSGI